jgi:hypothetical protein
LRIWIYQRTADRLSVSQCNDSVNGVHFSTSRIGAVVHFNIDRFPNLLCRSEIDTYFIDRRWKQGNFEGDRSQDKCEQHSPIRAPSPTLRTTKSGSGSGKGYEKRPPCTSEHIKPMCRINEREEGDG